MAVACLGYSYETGCIEEGNDHMLRLAGLGPVAWQKDDEDHGGEKCIGEAEATPYPERKGGAGGGNQELGCVRPRRREATAEKSELHSRAEKNNRAHGERFLDAVAIEPGLRSGDFSCRVADWSADQEENAGGLLRWRRKQYLQEQSGSGACADQGEQEQDYPQENVGGAKIRDGFFFQKFVLILGEEALAGPVFQERAGAQGFFTGCAVDSQAFLPKRRPIWIRSTSIATPLTTK